VKKAKSVKAGGAKLQGLPVNATQGSQLPNRLVQDNLPVLY
jgi:hypothetical protein